MSSDRFPCEVDVVIVGSGVAGLVTSLLIDESRQVLVITKKGKADSNTNFAQGGIAAAVGGDDNPSSHMVDTLRTGAGLSDRDVVVSVVNEGSQAIEWLSQWGVDFSHNDAGVLDLGREGGHSHRRIVHALDRTGEEIERSLLARVRNRQNIVLTENVLVVDAILDSHGTQSRVTGLRVVSEGGEATEEWILPCRKIVLATGGVGHVYQFTSNPAIATGDGLAIGYRAGVPVSNLEFVQFHPTTFYNPSGNSFLISESVRGEGARLRLPNGKLFMHRYDPRGELAPRDVVARAIDHEMRRHRIEYVYLDTATFDEVFARSRFPALHERCGDAGLDFPHEPIPVVPAAHYMCGGLNTGRTGATAIRGLYACGEVAHTGLHGANRLASNSLLEAVVFAARVAGALNEELHDERVPACGAPRRTAVHSPGDDDLDKDVAAQRSAARKILWHNVGIVRSDRGLEQAMGAIRGLRETVDSFSKRGINRQVVELTNLALVAELITRCAFWRKESRGLHYNIDHPKRGGPAWRRNSLVKPES